MDRKNIHIAVYIFYVGCGILLYANKHLYVYFINRLVSVYLTISFYPSITRSLDEINFLEKFIYVLIVSPLMELSSSGFSNGTRINTIDVYPMNKSAFYLRCRAKKSAFYLFNYTITSFHHSFHQPFDGTCPFHHCFSNDTQINNSLCLFYK